jgi:hypothetical protein
MSTNRPRLDSKTGHSGFITAKTTLTTEEIESLVDTTSETKKTQIIQELEVSLPSQTGSVTSFNGLTGAVQGVSSFNGATGSVTFSVDGGNL